MRVGQREKLSVIERGLIPTGRRVASGAGGGGEAGLRMRRVVRCVVLGRMT